MIRLDGEGLIPRRNRPESFAMTTEKLAQAALQNKSTFDFYRTFSRLNATYPNLHAYAVFPPAVIEKLSIPGPNHEDWPSIRLEADFLSRTRSRIRVSALKDEKISAEWQGANLIAVNHQSLRIWLNENFIFC